MSLFISYNLTHFDEVTTVNVENRVQILLSLIIHSLNPFFFSQESINCVYYKQWSNYHVFM